VATCATAPYNLLVVLIVGLPLGILGSEHRPVLRTRWPWLGAGHAAVNWAPNLIWQATHGWRQLAMASALHHENTTPADYGGGLPAQFLYLGLQLAPLVIAGFIRLWRTPELRFIAVTATLVVVYVLAWVPGKPYYTDGMAAAVLAAGALAAERWIGRARRPRLRRGLAVAAALAGPAIALPLTLPILPAGDVHDLPASAQQSSDIGDTIGWPQLTRSVAQDGAWPAPGSRPPRSSPDLTQKPARWTSSAPSTTCRPCFPATTPTGCGAPGTPPTAPCS